MHHEMITIVSVVTINNFTKLTFSVCVITLFKIYSWPFSNMHCNMVDYELPQWLSGKESTRHEGDTGYAGLTPGSGRSPGRGHGYTLQYSFLENSMDRGTWWVATHRVAKSQTWLKWLSSHMLPHYSFVTWFENRKHDAFSSVHILKITFGHLFLILHYYYIKTQQISVYGIYIFTEFIYLF